MARTTGTTLLAEIEAALTEAGIHTTRGTSRTGLPAVSVLDSVGECLVTLTAYSTDVEVEVVAEDVLGRPWGRDGLPSLMDHRWVSRRGRKDAAPVATFLPALVAWMQEADCLRAAESVRVAERNAKCEKKEETLETLAYDDAEVLAEAFALPEDVEPFDPQVEAIVREIAKYPSLVEEFVAASVSMFRNGYGRYVDYADTRSSEFGRIAESLSRDDQYHLECEIGSTLLHLDSARTEVAWRRVKGCAA